jgi:hypothetical protein
MSWNSVVHGISKYVDVLDAKYCTVVRVKNYEVVVFVQGGEVFPPCLEAGGVGDDVAVKAAVVVGLNHGVFAFRGDVVDLLG